MKAVSIARLAPLFVSCILVLSCRSRSALESTCNRANGRAELLHYYEAEPQQFKGRDLYVIARCYFDEGEPAKAEPLFEAYTRSFPHDGKGWIALGNTSFIQKKYTQAADEFMQAIALGEQDGVRMLAASYSGALEHRKIIELAPKLSAYIETQPPASDKRCEVVGVVLLAAINGVPEERDLFLKFIKYLPSDVSSWREDIRECVFAGFRKFGIPEDFRTSNNATNQSLTQ